MSNLAKARALREIGHTAAVIANACRLALAEAEAICREIPLGWTKEGFFARARKMPAAAASAAPPSSKAPAAPIRPAQGPAPREGFRTYRPSRNWHP